MKEYNEIINKIKDVLHITKFAVLATANKQGIISASQMCIVNDGLTVYFQTDSTFEKVKNIKDNANVAINLGAYYFKGKAKILGHPATNNVFIEKLKEKHLKTYHNYTNLANEILIEITLLECKIWGANNDSDVHDQESILVVDFITKSIKTIVCDKV